MPEMHPLQSVQDELTLVELLNRVLDRGVVVSGEITIGVAGIDLLLLDLQLVLTSTETARLGEVAASPGET